MNLSFISLLVSFESVVGLRIGLPPTNAVPSFFWGYQAERAEGTQFALSRIDELFFAPSSEAYNLRMEVESYSQWRQDLILAPLFKQVANGFFVESGARDGEEHSNTLYFEKLGWTGLLIEPSNTEFPALLSKHRKAYAYHGCLSPTWQSESLQFSDSGDGLTHLGAPKKKSVTKKFMTKAQPLAELMRRANRTTIDFWSLDIEGSEGVVLQHTDFSKIEIGVLLIEMNHDGPNTDAILSVLKDHGFVQVGHTMYDEGRSGVLDETKGGKRNMPLDGIFVNPQYFQKRNFPYPKELLWTGRDATWDWGDHTEFAVKLP